MGLNSLYIDTSKARSIAVFCTGLLALGQHSQAMAEGELSFNASVVSQYLWRGFDLNNQDIALQGGADYENDNGLYGGLWVSQYDFGDDDNGAEIDIYAGYSHSLNDDFWIDVSVTSYQYTGESDSSIEWKIGLGHEFFELNYHHDQDLDTDYIEFNPNYSFTDKWSINAHWGINDDGYDSYYDYSLSLGYAFSEKFELIIGYSDHELNEKTAEAVVFGELYAYF